MTQTPGDGTASAAGPRKAAVLAQLRALPSTDLRAFIACLAELNIDAVELPLGSFLAGRAQLRERAARLPGRQPARPASWPWPTATGSSPSYSAARPGHGGRPVQPAR